MELPIELLEILEKEKEQIKTYHKDLGFPKNLYIQEKFIRPKYTSHAIAAAKSDRYGEISLPSSFMIKRDEVVEIELLEGKFNKLVLRRPYSESYDLIIVLLLKGNKVKTVWLNSKTDAHITLDISKYDNEHCKKV